MAGRRIQPLPSAEIGGSQLGLGLYPYHRLAVGSGRVAFVPALSACQGMAGREWGGQAGWDVVWGRWMVGG